VKVIRDRAGTLNVDEFLARPLFAHLASVSPNGPRDSPVWFLWEDGAIWIIGSRRDDSFPSRVEAEPRCAVGIVDFDQASGRVHHAGFRGHATIQPFDVARAKRLLARYLGSEVESWPERFRATLADVSNVLVRFEPETAVARDVSYDVA
jgi:hypothetical protein